MSIRFLARPGRDGKHSRLARRLSCRAISFGAAKFACSVCAVKGAQNEKRVRLKLASLCQVYLEPCRIVASVARRAQGAAATKASGPSIITAIAPQPSPWPRMTTADATTDVTP
jgi:hypothetical protein